MAKKLTIEQQIAKQIEKLKKEQENLKKLKAQVATEMGKIAMAYFDSSDDLKRFLDTCKRNGYLTQFRDALAKEKLLQSQKTNVVKSDTTKPTDNGM